MRCFRLVFVSITTLAALSAADNSLQAVFARMDQASGQFKGLQADVKKVTHTAVINEDAVDAGTIAVKLQKAHEFRMLIDFHQPDPKKVLINGTDIEMYLPKANTVQVYHLGKSNRSQVEQFLLLGFGSNSKDLQNAYTVKLGGPEAIGDKKATRIELVPKSKDLASQFPKFELWIADDTGISIQQKLYEPGGNYSIATYSNMKVNPPLPDTALSLNLPKGVQREYPQK